MKKLLLLTLLIIPNLIWGQKIKPGEYCFHAAHRGTCIEIVNDSVFNYHSWSVKGENGHGKYHLDKKNLTLDFYSFDCIEIIEYDSSFGFLEDSLRLNFQVSSDYRSEKEKDSIFLPFANIEVSIKNYDNSGINKIFKIETDFDGKGEISIPKTDNEITIKVYYVGFESSSYLLKQNRNSSFQITLTPSNWTSIENQTYVFRLKKSNKKRIVLIDTTNEKELKLMREKEL